VSYRWDFTDGAVLGKTASRTYTKPGTYTATVTATDDEGSKTTREVAVTVTAPGVLPPTVEAGSSVTGGPARLSVAFHATGADPDGDPAQLKYAWDFGDGLGSYDQHPTHVYGAPGVYAAKVTVTDTSGASANKTVTITVTDAPGNGAPTVEEAHGAAGLDGNPMEVLFSARATDPDGDELTLSWNFDDGGTGTGASAKHTYTTAGTYDAKVTASDGHGGTHTYTVRVTVAPGANVAPTVDVLADPAQGPAPLPVRFSAQVQDPDGNAGNVSYVWAFGDGGFSAEKNPLHTYTAAGTYTASLTVTDARGGKTTKTVQITVTAVQGASPAPKTPDAAPEQAPWFGVSEPVKTSVAGFAKRGLSVRVTCTRAMSGSAKLTVTKAVAKKLGLKRATLASAKVRCGGAGSKTVRLKPSAATRRALAKAKSAVKVKLGVSLSGKQASRTVTLTRG
jgi:PKD repeat protein